MRRADGALKPVEGHGSAAVRRGDRQALRARRPGAAGPGTPGGGHRQSRSGVRSARVKLEGFAQATIAGRGARWTRSASVSRGCSAPLAGAAGGRRAGGGESDGDEIWRPLCGKMTPWKIGPHARRQSTTPALVRQRWGATGGTGAASPARCVSQMSPWLLCLTPT